MAKTRNGVIRAAGGIVWRPTTNGGGEPSVEIALIHRPQYDDWSLPKGKLAPGESEIEGALREVYEETGFRVHLGRPLGEVRYTKQTSDGPKPKVVRYWAMQVDGGAFFPNREVDDLVWVSPAEAEVLLTHDHDKGILDRFVRGPVLTRTVLLVRHGSAGDAAHWSGDDRLRPLDDVGRRQAGDLVRFLARFNPDKIVSADFVRCTQTVQPFSEATGIPIDIEPLLSETGYPGNEESAIKYIREVGSPGEAIVMCTQGAVVPDVVERIALADHIDLPESPVAKKGSVWALSFDGEQLVGAEYFPPPAEELSD
jgi:8-oxo-(d)GTP phosphatase